MGQINKIEPMVSTQSIEPRQPTPIDQLANQLLDGQIAFSPILATALGVKGYEASLDDFSPDAEEDKVALARRTLAELEQTAPQDAVDQVTVAAVRERLDLQLELHQAGEYSRCLNNLESPIQLVRDIFDLMPQQTVEDWASIARRLAAIPAAMGSYQRALQLGQRMGRVPAVRQVRAGIGQCENLAGAGGALAKLAGQGAALVGDPLAKDLAVAVGQARQAFADLAEFLAHTLAQHAPTQDAVGRDRYQLLSRFHVGAKLDLDQTYQWGLEQLDAIIKEQGELAVSLYGPGTTVEQAYAQLDQDPRYLIESAADLEEYMNQLAGQAMAGLDGRHFDIPGPVKQLVGRIAPSATGGIYYTPPTEDFSRPGTMWWSVPSGVNRFHTWRERTTVFHEGVPGHHLQIGVATFVADQLNRWRRQGCWVSGHGEGWALYAEALMGELGFLDDPGDRMGQLDAMRLRAARVALDIGVHLGKPFPERWGGSGQPWDATNARQFLRANVAMDDAFVDFELERYLGWPGQAPSYLVGMDHWQKLRAAVQRRLGLDLKTFHDQALRLGALPLAVLDQAILGADDAGR